MSWPGLQAGFLDGLDRAEGHVVVVREERGDLAFASGDFRKASMTSLPFARVKSPLWRLDDLHLRDAWPAPPRSRLLAVDGRGRPGRADQFRDRRPCRPSSSASQVAARRPSSTKSDPMKVTYSESSSSDVHRAVGQHDRDAGLP
jgi:hypothetical protein